MGRPERSLSSQTGPAAELAADLRRARQAAGSPSYRQMARAAHYAPATLARAAAGQVLPTLEVTLAYAAACGGQAAAWADRWHRAHRDLTQSAAARPASLAAGPEPPVGDITTCRPRPAQLPAARPDFVGRLDELARLDAASATGNEPGSPALILVSGPAGVGKTALALHWAHRSAGRYRDGQLYADLHGFAPTPAVPADRVLASFLRALGVPAAHVPEDVTEAAAVYRSLLAAARLLIVLDNARDPEQVRPLLPGSAGCTVLVTSRDQLTPLVAADGAHPVAVDLFTVAEARDLLASRLGDERVRADPAAAGALIGLCARLPLALSIAAARVSVTPAVSLRGLVSELRAAPNALDALDALDTGDGAASVRQVISWSCQGLPPAASRVFRLLGLSPGPDLSLAAAASLTGLTASAAQQALRALTRRCLLAEHRPGRFVQHDLLRVYAGEQARTAESASSRHLAVHRLLDHYLHTAHAAQAALHPGRAPIQLCPPQAKVTVTPAGGHDALGWFDAEHHNLLVAIDLAVTAGADRHAWQLAWEMATFLLRRGHTADWVRTQGTALEATRRLGDGTAEARIHLGLSRAYVASGRYREASQHAERALSRYRELGERVPQGRAHLSLNLIRDREGQHDQALVHAQRALAIFTEAGDCHGQATAHNAIGWYHALRGELDQAVTHCTHALRIFQAAADHAGEGAGWDTLGQAYRQAGDYPSAVASYQRAVELRCQSGGRVSQADSLTHLGDAHCASGHPQAAREAWQEALGILAPLGHPGADPVRDRLREHPGQG